MGVARRTEQSSLYLRDALGTNRLVPEKGDVGRPFCVAQTSIDCIAVPETHHARDARGEGPVSRGSSRRYVDPVQSDRSGFGYEPVP